MCRDRFTVTRYLSVIDVRGRSGRSLADDWRDEPRAYAGVLVPGYPNLVMIYGPNTNNGSILTMLEYQAAFAVRQLRWMLQCDIAWFDIRPDVVDDFNADLQEALDQIEVWQAKPDGYYRGQSGRIVTQWPHTMVDYDNRLRGIKADMFDVAVKPSGRLRGSAEPQSSNPAGKGSPHERASRSCHQLRPIGGHYPGGVQPGMGSRPANGPRRTKRIQLGALARDPLPRSMSGVSRLGGIFVSTYGSGSERYFSEPRSRPDVGPRGVGSTRVVSNA